jgi:hypothetical protein
VVCASSSISSPLTLMVVSAWIVAVDPPAVSSPVTDN